MKCEEYRLTNTLKNYRDIVSDILGMLFRGSIDTNVTRDWDIFQSEWKNLFWQMDPSRILQLYCSNLSLI